MTESLLAPPSARRGVIHLLGGRGMRILEGALFNLVLENKISLVQAKILRTLYYTTTLTTYELAKELELSEGIVVIETNDLLARKIVSEKFGLCFLQNFSEKIADLIKEEKIEKIKIKA